MNRLPFVRAIGEATPENTTRWCVFNNDRLLIPRSTSAHLPDTRTFLAAGVSLPPPLLLGNVDTTQYVAANIEVETLPEGWESTDLRRAYGQLSETEHGIAGYGAQIATWDRTTRFCPVCGTATALLPGERAKECPACHFRQYPRVSPCIIVLIHRPGQVLLTRQPSWPTGRYSLVAGFVEPGESAEACLRREVAEEVGVHVKDIRYLSSQPWPFPHQIMLGFTALFDSGELAVDTFELEDARWFDLDALPQLPPPMSIARRIIDWHLAAQHDPAVPFQHDLF